MQEGRGWEVKSTHFSAQSSLRTAQANAASERLQESRRCCSIQMAEWVKELELLEVAALLEKPLDW